jgi:hypothetical protein
LWVARLAVKKLITESNAVAILIRQISEAVF